MRSIIFLASPHKGLDTAALMTLVESKPTEDMIRELKAESPTLTELNDKFRFVAQDIDIVTCYELKPTKTAIEVFLLETPSSDISIVIDIDARRDLETRRPRGDDCTARLGKAVVSS